MNRLSSLGFVAIAGSVLALGMSQRNDWSDLSSEDAAEMTGALCYICTGTSNCPNQGALGPCSCVQQLINGIPWGCFNAHNMDSSQCSGGGTYKTCSFSWGDSCPSSEGTTHESPACGNYRTMMCDGAFACAGTCTIRSHGPCAYDCL